MTTTTCLDEGLLRAYLDHEAPDHDAVSRHVRGCLLCMATLRELRAMAASAAAALDTLDSLKTPAAPSGTQPASSAIHAAGSEADPARAAAAGGTPSPPRQSGRHLRRRWASSAAAALVVTGLVFTPAGQSVAGGFLAAFRSRDVVAVPITQDEANSTVTALERLTATPPKGLEDVEPKRVASVAQAQQKLSMPIAQPAKGDLPTELANVTPHVSVSPRRSVTISFDKAKTAAYLREKGSNVAIPAGYGSTRLTATMPGAAFLSYDKPSGPSLLVATSEPVAARTNGPLTLAQLRDFLVTVPGLPRSLTERLTGDDLLKGTLPIPVPKEYLKGDDTTVAGHRAIKIDAGSAGRALIWQDKERIVGIVGRHDENTIRTLAERVATR